MDKFRKRHIVRIVRLDCTMNKKVAKKKYSSGEKWKEKEKRELLEKRIYGSAHGRKLDKKKEEEERQQYVAHQEERQRLWDLQKTSNSAEWMELQNRINNLTIRISNYEQYKR